MPSDQCSQFRSKPLSREGFKALDSPGHPLSAADHPHALCSLALQWTPPVPSHFFTVRTPSLTLHNSPEREAGTVPSYR